MSWVLMGLIVAIAAALSLRPLWSRRTLGDMRRRSANVSGYRQRLAELDAEVAVGALDADTAAQLRDEMAARLLSDTQADTRTDPESDEAERGAASRSWAWVLVGCVLIAGISGLGYYRSQSRQIAGWIAEARHDPAAAQAQMIGSMVQRLEKRLKGNPDDADGWAMLGRSYSVLGRYSDAAGAYERANRLLAANPTATLLADEAEARLFADPKGSQALPEQLVNRALALEPGQPKALWYGGLIAAHSGDYATAFERWQALRGTAGLPDEVQATLDRRLPELAKLAGKELPASPAAAPGPRLRIAVSVDPSLAAEVGADASLFVLARRPGGGGPPLAVKRMSAAQLPTTVTLDDSNAMVSGLNLSSAEKWEVVARISRGGGPIAQSGDLEGTLAVSRADAADPVALKIDHRVP